jgi:hypothetical protein
MSLAKFHPYFGQTPRAAWGQPDWQHEHQQDFFFCATPKYGEAQPEPQPDWQYDPQQVVPTAGSNYDSGYILQHFMIYSAA